MILCWTLDKITRMKCSFCLFQWLTTDQKSRSVNFLNFVIFIFCEQQNLPLQKTWMILSKQSIIGLWFQKKFLFKSWLIFQYEHHSFSNQITSTDSQDPYRHLMWANLPEFPNVGSKSLKIINCGFVFAAVMLLQYKRGSLWKLTMLYVLC